MRRIHHQSEASAVALITNKHIKKKKKKKALVHQTIKSSRTAIFPLRFPSTQRLSLLFLMQTEHRRTQLLRAVIFRNTTSFNVLHNNSNNLQSATATTYKWSSSWLSTTERCCRSVGFPNVSLTISHGRPRRSPLIPQHL